MILYLLKSASCLALLLFFYHLILEKEKMHNFNRFYLLGSILFSFLVPFATITIPSAPEIIETFQNYSQPIMVEETLPMIIDEPFDYTQLFIGIYLLISTIFLIRFGRNLFKIIQKIRLNEKIYYKKATLVLVEDNILPHTFWKAIFINKKDYKNGKIEEELFTHELTHVTQKHTFDVLLIEILQILFWINPMFFFLKKAIQLNHEFLADSTVINQHKNTFQYQHLLVNKAAWKNEYYLASNLNYSLTKKRLKMMTKQSSQAKILFKKLAVIPLLTGFIFLFAERVEAQEIIEEIVEEVPFKKVEDTNIYKEFIYRNGFITTKDINGKTVKKKYSELTKVEKAKLPPPPSLKSKKKVPTKTLINNLKNSEKYAVWIDGKVVKNSALNNYKNSDFSSYFISFVHKNARSKRFPQENQAHLKTTTYFENQNKKRVKKFKEYLDKKHQIEEVKETPKKENKVFKIYKNSSSKQSVSFNQFENTQLKKYSNNTLKKYNNLAKKYNKIPVEKRIINLKDLNKLETLYRTLSKEEKKTAEPFPECYLANKGIEYESLKKYKKLNKLYESSRSQKPHFIKSSKDRQKDLKEQFSLLGSLYLKLSKENKRIAKRPIHPHDPYMRLRKNNKFFFKLRTELTKEDKMLIPPPPVPHNATKPQKARYKKAYRDWQKRTGNNFVPPPPPRNELDKIISMVKKGAKFYYENESISANKAIALFKKNNNFSFNSKSTNNKNYKVWIFKNKKDIDLSKKNVTYYLNGTKIKLSEVKKIKPYTIKSTRVSKDGKSVYITLKLY